MKAVEVCRKDSSNDLPTWTSVYGFELVSEQFSILDFSFP
jgi:hypothetical protein